MNASHAALAVSAITLCLVAVIAARSPEGSSANEDGISARLTAIEKRLSAIDDLSAEVKALPERLDRADRAERQGRGAQPSTRASAPMNAAAGAAGSGAARPAVDEAALATKVADEIEQRMNDKAAAVAGREYGDDGRWKAEIADLAKELALDEAMTAKAKSIFDNAKDRGYAMLKLQRLDGGSLLDDYVFALKNGPDPETATKTLFKRIVSERMPGSDETYLAGFIELSTDVDRSLTQTLDAATMKKFRALRVDLLETKTGYDPTGDYVRARLQ